MDPDANAALDEWRRLGGRQAPEAAPPAVAASASAAPAPAAGGLAALLRALAAIFARR